jgi:rhodanese-related sulfurtransferase
MRADVGDSLVVKGATNGDPDQRGIITECAHGRRHAALHGSLARTGHQALEASRKALHCNTNRWDSM